MSIFIFTPFIASFNVCIDASLYSELRFPEFIYKSNWDVRQANGLTLITAAILIDTNCYQDHVYAFSSLSSIELEAIHRNRAVNDSPLITDCFPEIKLFLIVAVVDLPSEIR